MVVYGWLVHTLQAKDDWNDVQSYQVVFFGYAAIGLIMFAVSCTLSRKCEPDIKDVAISDSETTPLLAESDVLANGTQSRKSWPRKSIVPAVSKESRKIFVKLAVLFALDAFGSGLAPL
jgi:hypothetical protein